MNYLKKTFKKIKRFLNSNKNKKKTRRNKKKKQKGG